MPRKLFILFCGLVSALLLASCATVFTGTSQTVTINSNVEGAEVRIDGNVVGTTPYSGKVRKGNSAKSVLITKSGYQAQQISLNTAINPVTIISIVFWDLGTTDFLSGAAWEYSPNSYYVNLLKNEKSTSSARSELREIRLKEYAMVKHRQLLKRDSNEARALYTEFFEKYMVFESFQVKLAEIGAVNSSPVGFGENVWKWLESERS